MPTDIRMDGETFPTVHLHIAYNHKKWYNDTMGRILQELTACGGQGTYNPPEHIPLYDVLCGRMNLETPTLQPHSADNTNMWRVDFKKPVIKILKGETTKTEDGKQRDKYGLFYSVRVPEEIRRALEETVLKGCRLIESGDFMVLTINRMPASRQAEEAFRQRLAVYDPGTRGDLHSVCIKDNGIMHRFKKYGKVVGFVPDNITGERNNILDIYRRVEEKLEEIGHEQVEAQRIEQGIEQSAEHDIEAPEPTQAQVDTAYREALREGPVDDHPHVDPDLREAGTVVVRRSGGEEVTVAGAEAPAQTSARPAVSGAGASAQTAARPATNGTAIGEIVRQPDGNYYKFLGYDEQGAPQLVLEAYGLSSEAVQLRNIQEALRVQPMQPQRASLVPLPGQAPVSAPGGAVTAPPAGTTASLGNGLRPVAPATVTAQTTTAPTRPVPVMATTTATITHPSPAIRPPPPHASTPTGAQPQRSPRRTEGLVYSPENGANLALSVLRSGANTSDIQLGSPAAVNRDRPEQPRLETSALEAPEEPAPLNQTIQQQLVSPLVDLVNSLVGRMDSMDRNMAVTIDALRHQTGDILASLNRHLDATNSTVATVDDRVTSFEGQVIPLLTRLVNGSADPPAYGTLNLRSEGRTSPTLRSDFIGPPDQPGVQLVDAGPPGAEGATQTVLTGPQLYIVAKQLSEVVSPGGLETVDFSIPGLTASNTAEIPAEYRTASQAPGSGRFLQHPEDQIRTNVRMFSHTRPDPAQGAGALTGTQLDPQTGTFAGASGLGGLGAAVLPGGEPFVPQPSVETSALMSPIAPPSAQPQPALERSVNSPVPPVPLPELHPRRVLSPRFAASFEEGLNHSQQQNQVDTTQ